MFGRIHLGSCLILDFCFKEVFDYYFNFFTRVWSIHTFFYSRFSLGRLYDTKICPFLLGCPVVGVECFTIFFHNPLYFCGTIVFSPLSFLISFIRAFLFFWWVYLEVCQFFFFLFKEPALSFIDLYYCPFSLSFFFFFFVFLPFLGQLPWHMEVPRLGVESEL